ncbi:MAG: cytochrome P450, partial [Pseudomonadota bacterium]
MNAAPGGFTSESRPDSPDYVPPMPPERPDGLPFWRIWLRARRNLFAALPRKLYRAWLTEVRTPWYNSYMPNQPDLVRRMLVEEPDAFPKSDIVRQTIGDLLGESVFVTNGEKWKRQRRIIDPSFEGGKLRETFSPMLAAAEEMASRLEALADGDAHEIEIESSHAAADVIFRTLFSQPITADAATRVFHAFRRYQLAAPMMSPADLMRIPEWFPRLGPSRWKKGRAAREIRALLMEFVEQRRREIAAGTAPKDLATAIMTTEDPVTGDRFDAPEMSVQMAFFFLAGHETSASALAWALYLVANCPDVQEQMHAEAAPVFAGQPTLSDMRRLPFIRDVFRETLRLYPPVPMMIREASCPVQMRDKDIAAGSPLIISSWHMGRHERVWDRPHVFDPDRWKTEACKRASRDAWIPFSTGPRVCTGAAFGMQEGVILLGLLAARFRFLPVAERVPEPMAHLTVRSRNGIWLKIE